MRRLSLEEEFQGKDPDYMKDRLQNVLQSLPNGQRTAVLKNYESHAPLLSTEKTFFMARLLDSLFDRKPPPAESPPAPPLISNGHLQIPKAALAYCPSSETATGTPFPLTQHHHSTPNPTSALSDNSGTFCRSTPPPSNYVGTTVQGGTIATPKKLLESDCSAERGVLDYKFIKTIGKGTFGKVKLAQHSLTRELVAVKVIERVNIKTPKQKATVNREVRLMKLLHHPHIVNVLEVYESRHYIFIIMEYANGGELFDYIVKNRMIGDNEARHFFRQILSAVDYCHSPENLLLDANHNIKIIDFGFGNTYHRDQLLDTFCGSPFYAAPEMIRGIRYTGPEVDVWSLGVVLFAILAGSLPFDAPNVTDLYAKIGMGKYTCPPHLSPEAVHLISRMLTVDPRRRATVSEISRHVWVNLGYSEHVQAYLLKRPQFVAQPQTDSLLELVSYGFREEDALYTLRTQVSPHPINSLYHLIEESRQRKVTAFLKAQWEEASKRSLSEATLNLSHQNSLNTIDTRSSISSSTHHRSLIASNDTPCCTDTQIIASSPVATIDYDSKRSTNLVNYYLPRFIRPRKPVSHIPAQYCPNSSAHPVLSPNIAQAQMNGYDSPEIDSFEVGNSKDQRPSPLDLPSQNVRGLFNIQTTIPKPVATILAITEASLHRNNISFEKKGSLIFVCEDKANRFEIEISSPPRASVFLLTSSKNQKHVDVSLESDIYMRRLKGNVWTHKRICNRLIEEMRL